MENPRVTLHVTPTGCSWLNMVEIFFGIITRQAIRRGTFTSVKELTAAIGAFIDAELNGQARYDKITELLKHYRAQKR